MKVKRILKNYLQW
uniref:Truncated envelope glycoprotein n=1 Tax=Human immunodeficiency virus type 1 TaxID=11676 RepID=A0A0H3YA69_HV1|nr:truncated envelope glycoprotein [Human immunodeficiency virus 1]